MEAMNQATTALGDEDISQGLSAAQVLADLNARQMASRWRSGSESRRLTALLAKLREGLASVFPGQAPAPARDAAPKAGLQPVRARPIRGESQTVVEQRVYWRTELLQTFRTWVSWKTLGSLLLLVLFPRLLAFLIVMSVRVLARIALMLSSRLIRELVSQVTFMAADLEANIIDWLYQAWMETPSAMEALQSAPSSSSCAAPTWTPPSALAGPAAPTSLPTRPVDFLTLFLLLVQTLRSLPRGWGGWVRPQLG